MQRLIIKTALLFVFLLTLSSSNIYSQETIPITTNSETAKTLFLKGRTTLDNIDFQKAAELFDKAIEADNNFALAHLYRAWTGIGGYNVVNEHLDKAVSLVDNVTLGEKVLIQYTDANFNNDDTRSRIQLSKLIGMFPNDKRVQNVAGIHYYQNQNYEQALEHFNRSVELDADFPGSYNMMGYCNMAVGNYTAAEKSFKKYISLIPYHANPYDSYAEFLLEQGRYDESIDQYKKALEKDSGFISALIGIGHNYVYLENYDEARNHYKKAHNTSKSIGGKLNSQYWITTSYVHQGFIDKALSSNREYRKLAQTNELWNRVIGSYNIEGFILTESGMPEEGLGKFEEASNLLKTANLKQSTKDQLMFNIGVNKCYALTANNMLDEATKEATMCIKVANKRDNENDWKNLHGVLGQLEYRKGNFTQALTHLKKSDIDDPYNMYQMGMVYEKMGNSRRANEMFDRVKFNNQNGIGQAIVRERVAD